MDEKSPAFRFYARDFLADSHVARMGNAETGIYIRLLCFCWIEGSIPADLGELALMLPRTSKRDVERSWGVVGRCFSPHPTEAGRLIQRRLEHEREKQVENRERRAAAGREGGLAKARNRASRGDQSPSNATGSLEQSQEVATAKSSLAFASAFASAETPLAGARGREETALEAASPGIALGVWFVLEGVKAGAIPVVQEPFAERTAYRTLDAANALLGSSSLDEIKRRAARMFARATKRGPDRWRAVKLEMLVEHWDRFGEDEPSGGVPAELTSQLDAMVRG